MGARENGKERKQNLARSLPLSYCNQCNNCSSRSSSNSALAVTFNTAITTETEESLNVVNCVTDLKTGFVGDEALKKRGV